MTSHARDDIEKDPLMSTTRRTFLLDLAAGSTGIGAGWFGHRPLEAGETAALDAARRQAAHRRRRIIFNNDGDDIWVPGADTAERFLAVRHTPLVGTRRCGRMQKQPGYLATNRSTRGGKVILECGRLPGLRGKRSCGDCRFPVHCRPSGTGRSSDRMGMNPGYTQCETEVTGCAC
jgi:hypothetical protein